MKSVCSRVVCLLLVVSVAAPASSAFAQGRTVASTSSQVSRVSAEQPSSSSLRASIATAVAKSVAAEQQSGGQGATKPKTIRAQMGGGGGKGQMIMMLVSTVVGLAATVYMLKYIQKQQKDATEGGS